MLRTVLQEELPYAIRPVPSGVVLTVYRDREPIEILEGPTTSAVLLDAYASLSRDHGLKVRARKPKDVVHGCFVVESPYAG